MRLGAARVLIVVSLALAGIAAPALGATTDVAKVRACRQIRAVGDGTTLTTTEKRALREAVTTLQTSRSDGAARVARRLNAANDKGADRQEKVLDSTREWCGGLGTATTLPPALRTFEPQHFEGTRGGFVPLAFAADQAAIARIVANVGARVAVESSDVAGRRIATLVDTDGPYDGLRPLNFEVGTDPTQLEIDHEGTWSIDILPLASAPEVSTPGTYEGVGDSVLVIKGNPSRAHSMLPRRRADSEWTRTDAFAPGSSTPTRRTPPR